MIPQAIERGSTLFPVEKLKVHRFSHGRACLTACNPQFSVTGSARRVQLPADITVAAYDIADSQIGERAVRSAPFIALVGAADIHTDSFALQEPDPCLSHSLERASISTSDQNGTPPSDPHRVRGLVLTQQDWSSLGSLGGASSTCGIVG